MKDHIHELVNHYFPEEEPVVLEEIVVPEEVGEGEAAEEEELEEGKVLFAILFLAVVYDSMSHKKVVKCTSYRLR